MSNATQKTPLALAISSALTIGLSATVNAADNPFGMTALSAGYMVASAAEGKCGGDAESKDAEGKCGEGKCGGDSKDAGDKDAEGKCGEGKCGK